MRFATSNVVLVVATLVTCATPSRAQLWSRSFNGPGNGANYATAIGVDAAENVYVTGATTNRYGDFDYATVKYDSGGTRQWVAYYDGPGHSNDYATAMAVDAAGNVYVTGWSTGSAGDTDFATIKYDTKGVRQWVARYDGPGHYADAATAIALDVAGNVYVTGFVTPSATSTATYNFATVKYNPQGVRQWVAQYEGPGHSNDQAQAIAVDSAGNVYVTGLSGGLGSVDYATIKYNSDGTEAWVKRYDGPAQGDDVPTGIGLDALANVYVTGGSVGANGAPEYATLKYDTDGALKWVRRYSGPAHAGDIAAALVVTTTGEVCVTGESHGVGTGFDYATIQYDSAGARVWGARYDGPVHRGDVARAIAIDPAGNVVVTGSSVGSGTAFDYLTIKYAPTGAKIWAHRHDGTGHGIDVARAVAVDAVGNVYVTGSTYSSLGHYVYTTLKYAP